MRNYSLYQNEFNVRNHLRSMKVTNSVYVCMHVHLHVCMDCILYAHTHIHVTNTYDTRTHTHIHVEYPVNPNEKFEH